jgi:hypothetical protein
MATVAELIEQLSKLDQGRQISIDTDEIIKIHTMRSLSNGEISYILYSEEEEEEEEEEED